MIELAVMLNSFGVDDTFEKRLNVVFTSIIKTIYTSYFLGEFSIKNFWLIICSLFKNISVS